jgi:hypothetical protein
VWHSPMHDLHVGFLLCKMGEAYGVTTCWASLTRCCLLLEVGVCLVSRKNDAINAMKRPNFILTMLFPLVTTRLRKSVTIVMVCIVLNDQVLRIAPDRPTSHHTQALPLKYQHTSIR